MRWKWVIRVAYVVQEFSTGVTFNIVSIEITPSELHVNPVLVASSTIKNIFAL